MNQQSHPFKKKGGQPPGTIWEDIQQGESVASGKFSATCKYCRVTWTRGVISKLEQHLSNYCPEASESVVRKYITKIIG